MSLGPTKGFFIPYFPSLGWFLPQGHTEHRCCLDTSGARGCWELTPLPACHPRRTVRRWHRKQQNTGEGWEAQEQIGASNPPGACEQLACQAKLPKYLFCTFLSALTQALVLKCHMKCHFFFFLILKTRFKNILILFSSQLHLSLHLYTRTSWPSKFQITYIQWFYLLNSSKFPFILTLPQTIPFIIFRKAKNGNFSCSPHSGYCVKAWHFHHPANTDALLKRGQTKAREQSTHWLFAGAIWAGSSLWLTGQSLSKDKTLAEAPRASHTKDATLQCQSELNFLLSQGS